jgi:hypothetical protein
MATEALMEAKPCQIRITTIEMEPLELGNLTAFMYDLVLLHDRLLLILSDEYEYRYHLSPFFYRRTGRPVRKLDRLQVKLVTKKSPFIIELIIASTAAGLAWTLIKILEKLTDWKEDRAIKRLERRKLELEVERLKLPAHLEDSELRDLVEESLGSALSRKHPKTAKNIENAVMRDAHRLGTNEQLAIDRVEILETNADSESR